MTIPSERMRALRWGWELLEVIQKDDLVPETFKRRAELVVGRYPTPANLVDLVGSGTERLSYEVAEAIDEAGRLFEDIRRRECTNGETLRLATFTLRHFPLHGTALDQARYGTLGGLRCWLDVED